jgi:asparagine synthetase B (glutamine-hydrolysing)
MRFLPGLTVSIGVSGPASPIPSGASSEHLSCDIFATNGMFGTLRRFPNNRAAGVSLDARSRIGLAIDAGPDLLLDGMRATPKRVLDTYLERGKKVIDALDGQFLLVAWQEGTDEILLASDRYGLRPHYRCRREDKILFGPSAQEIAYLQDDSLRIDDTQVYAALSYSRVSPGSLTWFEGFEALPPAVCMIWKNGQLRSETQYWDYFGGPGAGAADDLIDELAETFKAAVRNSLHTGHKTGLCLSGGLDSRLVVAAMTDEMRRQVIGYTWGEKRHADEVAIAGRIAQQVGMDWRFVKMAPADFVTDLKGAVAVLEGRDQAIQGYGRKAFADVARDCSVATTGLALDILVSGSYSSFLLGEDLNKIPFSMAKDTILDRYKYFKFDPVEMFRDPKVARHKIDEIKTVLKSDFLDIGGELANSLDRFAFRQRVWRHIFPRQQWQRLFVEDVTPTFSNRLIDLLSVVPFSERANHTLARKLLERLDPTLMDLPYQGTMLPVNVPVSLWKQAAAIEAQKEKLYRQIYHDTDAQVFVPYERYYTNFDEWQRMDPDWTRVLDDYLLGDESRLTAKYVRRDWIQKLIEQQRSGANANFAHINVLLSVETMLRKFT